MSTNAVARRYARALMQLASEQGMIERYHEELAAFAGAVGSDARIGVFLASPACGKEAKCELVAGLIGSLSLSRTIADFLRLLLDKKRMELLPSIIAEYRSFADDFAGVLRSSVTSALPLSEKQVEDIRRALETVTGKKIILTVSEDPELIGGVVTRIGDKVFDGSIRTQLARIQDILQKG